MPAGLVLLLLATQAAGIWAGQFLPGASHARLPDRPLSWDGRIYFDVAQQGYGWNPAKPFEHQNIAFFPGQPLLDHAGSLLAGRGSPLPALLLSLGFGSETVS